MQEASQETFNEMGLKEILAYAAEKNVLLEPQAAHLLIGAPYHEIIDELLSENVFILDAKKIGEKIVSRKTKMSFVKEIEVLDRIHRTLSKEYSANFKVLKHLCVEEEASSRGTAKDFLALFQDRYTFLSDLLSKRGINAQPISKLDRITMKRDVELIGMVAEKWISKNGHLCMKLEDLEAHCIALVLKSNASLLEKAEHVSLDDVIGIKGKKGAGDLIIIEDIVFPDLPLRKTKTIDEDLSIGVISDIHIGSRLFLQNEFEEFLEWIHSGRNGSEKIKYLFVAGDTIDGIGVYPQQIDELVIKDIYDQYKVLSEYIQKIPEHIEVFIAPGQHDAVRWADPQPPLSKEFVPELYKLSNVHFVSSPSWVEVEGLVTLMYHGGSLHDLIGSVSFLNPNKPAEAIKEALVKRTLMLSYGVKRPYAPMKKDLMLVREVPDIYLGGDFHHVDYTNYRGTTIINSGCWQHQTEYGMQGGYIATPGIVPELNLKTSKITEKVFYQG
ncbi:MAG: metallophosphoesterase [Candidatus Diapherotrites archaeon]|nr:metallophosphoesterase [Candidatus Diapherotrites archaeon]